MKKTTLRCDDTILADAEVVLGAWSTASRSFEEIFILEG